MVPMPDDYDWDDKARLPGFRSVIDPADTSGIKNDLIDRTQRAVLEEALRGIAGGRVLDLGCGTGRLTDWLSRSGADPVGSDGSEAMLRGARERGTRSPLAAADAVALPFADSSFHAVVSVGVIAVMATDSVLLSSVLSEVARILAPGGHFIAIEQVADEGLGRGTSMRGYGEAMGSAGLSLQATEHVRLGDSRVVSRCLHHPWMRRLPGTVSRIRAEARAADGPFTGGRYVDELFVATARH